MNLKESRKQRGEKQEKQGIKKMWRFGMIPYKDFFELIFNIFGLIYESFKVIKYGRYAKNLKRLRWKFLNSKIRKMHKIKKIAQK